MEKKQWLQPWGVAVMSSSVWELVQVSLASFMSLKIEKHHVAKCQVHLYILKSNKIFNGVICLESWNEVYEKHADRYNLFIFRQDSKQETLVSYRKNMFILIHVHVWLYHYQACSFGIHTAVLLNIQTLKNGCSNTFIAMHVRAQDRVVQACWSYSETKILAWFLKYYAVV